MGIGPIAFTDRAASSLPAGRLRVSLGPAIGPKVSDVFPVSSLPIPVLEAVLYGSPVGHLHHHIEGDTLVTGLLAPKAGPTTSGLTAATAQLTFTGQPTDGDKIRVGTGGTPYWPNATTGAVIYFRAAFNNSGAHEVLIGATLADTIANLKALLEGTSGHGTTYNNGWLVLGFVAPGQYEFSKRNDIEVSADTATTITFRALTPGVIGNTYRAEIITDSGGVMGGGFAAISNYFAGGVSGSGDAPAQGRYRYYTQHYRSVDGARSGLSEQTEQRLDGPSNVTIGSPEAAQTRDDTDYISWYRTTVSGGRGQKYKGADVAPGSYPATDALSDDALTGYFATLYEPANHRPYEGGYPTRRAHLELFDSKVFAAGVELSAPYDQGELSVTEDSYDFTLDTDGHWLETAIGRNVYLDGGTDPYTVVAFDPSTHAGKFNKPCSITTGSYTYELKDERDPFGLDWSASRFINNWPVANNLVDVVSTDPKGVTGIYRGDKALALFTRTGKWRVENIGGGAYKAWPSMEGAGLFTHNAVIRADRQLFWIGPDGLFVGTVEGGAENISHPPADESGSRGIQATWERINKDMADLIVGDYNPTTQIARWILPMDEDEVCRHELVLDLRTNSLSLDFVGPRTFVRSVVGPDGRHHTLAGDPYGKILELDIGYEDGGHGASSTVLAVSSWDWNQTLLTFAGTPFSGLSLGGTGIVLYDEDTGEWEDAYVVSNTSSALRLSAPLSESPTGKKVLLGGITMRWRTGSWDYEAPEIKKHLAAVHLAFVPQSVAAKVYLAAAVDEGDFTTFQHSSLGEASDYADLSTAAGEKLFIFRTAKCNRMALECLAFEPGVDVHINGYMTSVNMRTEVVG